MAIQNRRGVFINFDPTKLLPGEWAVVTGGDTHASDGKAVYMCFDSSGTVKRMATYEDMTDQVAAAVEEGVEQEIQTQVGSILTDCQTATSNANTATSNANTATASANTAAARAEAAASAIEDPSSAQITFTQASARTNIVTGETIATVFGKIKKWFADLKAGAFADVANSIAIQDEGYVLDGRVGRTLAGLISANGTNIGNIDATLNELFLFANISTGTVSWPASATTSHTISLSGKIPDGYSVFMVKNRNTGGNASVSLYPVACYYGNGNITVKCRNGSSSAISQSATVDIIFIKTQHNSNNLYRDLGNITD